MESVTTVGTSAGAFQKIQLVHPSGFSAQICPYGAQLLSWQNPNGEELLFLSDEAVFEEGKAIRGGIPIVFPQFSRQGTLPSHGFARTALWTVKEPGVLDVGEVQLMLGLDSCAETLALWPYEFRLEFKLWLSEVLEMELRVSNTGKSPFSFKSALHNYFRVGDVGKVWIEGLSGLEVRDLATKGEQRNETQPFVTVTGAVDRLYLQAPDHLEIGDVLNNRTLIVEKSGFPDAVLWNPGDKRLADLGPEEFKQFVCVEVGCIDIPVELKPGELFAARQILQVSASKAEDAD